MNQCLSTNPFLSQRFSELSSLLGEWQQCWRPIAFHQSELPWMEQYPALVQRLRSLEPTEVERLATNTDALLAFMAPYLPFVQHLEALCHVPTLREHPMCSVDSRFKAGIPGRKWSQIEAFAGCITPASMPILEWCAGKSHLGFYLQQHQQQAVTAVEWDNALVTQANQRAQRTGAALFSHAVNVLTAQADPFIQSQQQIVALHACGELHERLLHLCAEKRPQQIHLAPCCYHKRSHDVYRPLSAAGRATGLVLNKLELHTAVMETATAGATVRRQRERLQIMRLGFDCLQRQLRASNDFLPLPSLPAHWARAEFAKFCRHCAALKHVPLPDSVDWSFYLAQGEQRFREVSALDLVRFLFRRPLELWLVLDRALLLEEQGYAVRIGTFCASAISPRNLLLQAWRV